MGRISEKGSSMNITVLVENSTPSSRFIARHGLSLFIETGERRILFDVGPDAAFLDNARTLGIDVAAADTVVISHGHSDHGGGLKAYLERTRDVARPAPVYVREHAFEKHLSGTRERHRSIGLDPALAEDERVVTTGEVRALGDGLLLFSCAGGEHALPASNGRLFACNAQGELVPDAFLHEQSLLVHEGDRYILISGCSHAGILNIMAQAETLAGAPLDAVVAGFHLTAPSAGTMADAEQIRLLGREMASLSTCFYTFHCTGLDAYSLLRDELGDRLRYLYTGASVEV